MFMIIIGNYYYNSKYIVLTNGILIGYTGNLFKICTNNNYLNIFFLQFYLKLYIMYNFFFYCNNYVPT